MKLSKYNSFRLAILCGTLEALFTVLFFANLGKLVANDTGQLLHIGIFLLIMIVLSCIFGILRANFVEAARFYLSLNSIENLTEHYCSTNIENMRKNNVGEMVATFNSETKRIISFILDPTYNIVINLFKLIVSGIILLLINVWLIFFLILVILVLYFIPKKESNDFMKYVESLSQSISKLFSTLTEYVRGLKTFRYMNRTSFYNDNILETSHLANQELGNLYEKNCKLNIKIIMLAELMLIMFFILLGYFSKSGVVSKAEMISALAILPIYVDAAPTVFVYNANRKSGINLLKSVYADIAYKDFDKYTKSIRVKDLNLEEVKIIPNKKNINVIETKNISVSYAEKNISIPDIRFEKGKKYIIIGESGCGKSTLLKIITGEYTNYDGEVIIDGKVKDKNKDLFDSIAVMTQDPYLFNDTIEKNIKLGNYSADVRNLLDKVKFHTRDIDFIVGEDGKNLSGGEKKRIALARSLALEKDFLFLDEPTANLDNDNAILIEKLLLSLDICVVMITHRLTEEIKNMSDVIYDFSHDVKWEVNYEVNEV